MRHEMFRRQEHGATAVEYALVVAILAAVVASAVPQIGSPLSELLTSAESAIQDAADGL